MSAASVCFFTVVLGWVHFFSFPLSLGIFLFLSIDTFRRCSPFVFPCLALCGTLSLPLSLCLSLSVSVSLCPYLCLCPYHVSVSQSVSQSPPFCLSLSLSLLGAFPCVAAGHLFSLFPCQHQFPQHFSAFPTLNIPRCC